MLGVQSKVTIEMGSQKGVSPYWGSAVYMKVLKSLADEKTA